MVKTPDWLRTQWQVATQPVDTHSCVNPLILGVSGQRLPVDNEGNNASSRSFTTQQSFGDDVDENSAHKACSSATVLMARLSAIAAKQTVNKEDANASSAPGTHKVLAKQQFNAKAPNPKPKQMPSNHRLTKDVPAVQRGVRPQDGSLLDERPNKRQRYCETAKASAPVSFGEAIRREATLSRCISRQRYCDPAKASTPVSFGEAIRREALLRFTSVLVRDSSPMLLVLPPAPLPKPAEPPQWQERSQVTITASKASTVRKHKHSNLPKPPLPPRRPPQPPPAPP